MSVRTHRRARLLAAVLLSGLVLLGSTAGTAVGRDLGPRRTMLALTNEDRAERDRKDLAFAAELARYAKRHSKAMASKGYLYHSTETELRDALEGHDWTIGGENVGVGGSLESLEAAFMASKPHRQNILRRAFDHAAVGIARQDGRIWITVIFYG